MRYVEQGINKDLVDFIRFLVTVVMLVLGVESSCDETSVSIVRDGKEVLCNVINSQIDIHKLFGGVVPEIASRHHVYQVSMIFEEAFKQTGLSPNDIDL